MQRSRLLVLGFVLLGVLVLSLPAEAQKTMSVQVKEAQLRATPSFLGKIVARASYGERVNVAEDRGTWKRVLLPGGKAQGWVHASALTTKRIVLRAGQTDVRTSATQGEIALAGKGFNEQVEAAFQREKKLDYTWIDRMETFRVTPEEMRAFLTAGHVTPAGEGGRP